MGTQINLKNMARQLQNICKTMGELVCFDEENDEWKWKDDRGDVWPDQYGEACVDFDEMAAVLGAVEEVPEEREVGERLLYSFEIMRKYRIADDDFRKISKFPRFPKYYAWEGMRFYVDTEIRDFLKNYGEQK
ncbi:hypothetical protein FACS189472_13680 [Alphaproteobacteria bacterium]|nr:hypothetical protein FACS189472_13680 [Alphaproteobacteria bacterium]